MSTGAVGATELATEDDSATDDDAATEVDADVSVALETTIVGADDGIDGVSTTISSPMASATSAAKAV